MRCHGGHRNQHEVAFVLTWPDQIRRTPHAQTISRQSDTDDPRFISSAELALTLQLVGTAHDRVCGVGIVEEVGGFNALLRCPDIAFHPEAGS
jgi:hypothetical protein